MFITAQVSLRILAILFTLTAISLIVTDKQSVTVFGLQFKARYSYASAYRFLVGADAVVCSCSALSLAFLYHLRISENSTDSQALLRKYFFLFIYDMVMLMLVVGGCAAATAIGYVARHGEEHMAWEKVCDQVSDFCNKMLYGTILSYLAFISYFSLSLISAHRLMSHHPTK
ncbi:hypothetical protein TIFTF001_026551 [Ficus carica]|uniref:CASP-like protein n=1 Tax=Ficus carica TaxID=3494 RepID=A0AA88IX16_FICCA|nr:hypothetical protein TIFTF001_026551 [Ficus carica]